MKSSVLAIALIVLAQALAPALAGSSESHQQKRRRDTCDHLVQEPVSTPASPSPPSMVPAPPPGECVCTPPGPTSGPFRSQCPLIVALRAMEANLSVSQAALLEVEIESIEANILANGSLSDDEKVVAIALELKIFLSVHVDIYNVISYLPVADWGFLIDVLYVDIDIELELTDSVIAVRPDGGCDVTDALLNASANGTPDEQAECQKLVVQIKAILADVTLTVERRKAKIFEVLDAECQSRPDLADFILNIHIHGFGSLRSLWHVCRKYHQLETISVVLTGSSPADCELLAALNDASNNASFTLSQRVQIVQLIQQLEVFFQGNVSLALRLKFVSQSCWHMFDLEPWMVSIVESVMIAQWGSVKDMIFCSGICTNYGCGNLDDQLTTQAPPTTALVPANCQTIGSLIVVDVNNQTILTNVLLQAYNGWTSSQKLGFNSCFNKVRKAIWDNVSFPDQHSKLVELNSDFLQYNNNSVTAQQLVFNLTISVWQGTIGQFVSCCGCCS